MTPPPPWIGSPMKAATVSGPPRGIASPRPRAAPPPTVPPGLAPRNRHGVRASVWADPGTLRAPMPHIDVPEPREPVDVLVAADVPDRRAAPADIDDRLRVLGGMVERMDQVLLVGLHELGGGQRHSPLLEVTGGQRPGEPGGSRRAGSRRRAAAARDTSTPTPARASRSRASRSPGDGRNCNPPRDRGRGELPQRRSGTPRRAPFPRHRSDPDTTRGRAVARSRAPRRRTSLPARAPDAAHTLSSVFRTQTGAAAVASACANGGPGARPRPASRDEC